MTSNRAPMCAGSRRIDERQKFVVPDVESRQTSLSRFKAKFRERLNMEGGDWMSTKDGDKMSTQSTSRRLVFEQVITNLGGYLWRAAVPGGWLMKHVDDHVWAVEIASR